MPGKSIRRRTEGYRGKQGANELELQSRRALNEKKRGGPADHPSAVVIASGTFRASSKNYPKEGNLLSLENDEPSEKGKYRGGGKEASLRTLKRETQKKALP